MGIENVIIRAEQQSDTSSVKLWGKILAVIPLHTPIDTAIVLPLGNIAYLIGYNGVILRTYRSLDRHKEHFLSSSTSDDLDYPNFVAATVSSSNKWLYLVTDVGFCFCFDLPSGKIKNIIRDFSEESININTGEKVIFPIVTSIIHHPHIGLLAAFSSDVRQ